MSIRLSESKNLAFRQCERRLWLELHHPDQRGSWSIKYVTPAVAPDLRYDQLEGVQNGGGAMHADLEAIDEATTHARKGELEAQLRDYCRLDTLTMVRLWQFFAGKPA